MVLQTPAWEHGRLFVSTATPGGRPLKVENGRLRGLSHLHKSPARPHRVAGGRTYRAGPAVLPHLFWTSFLIGFCERGGLDKVRHFVLVTLDENLV